MASTRAAVAGQRVGVAQHPGAGGHGPLQARRGRWRRSRATAARRRQLVEGHVGPQRRPCRGSQPRRGRCRRCDRPMASRRRRRRPRPSTARMAPVACGPDAARLDRLDDPGAEHHALEQRVRRQPVGAVHARAGDLARGPQPGQRRGAVEVGDDAAARGSAPPARSAASRRAGSRPTGRSADRDGREPLVEARRGRWRRATGGRRPGRACAGSSPATPRRGAGARRRSARPPRRGAARRGPAAPRTAAAAACCGWCSAVGWNCTNSTSATADPGPQRHGDAVAGGLDRVGGDREQLAGAAGGEQHVGGPDHLRRARRRRGRPTPTHRPPSTSRSSAKARSCTAAAVRRTASTSARSISTPVAAPPACTTRARLWPPSRASSRWPCSSRSNMAPRAISSLTRPGPLVDQHPHGVGVAQAGAGGQGVGQVEVGRVGVARQHRGHAALGPPGGGLVQLALGEHADPQAVDVGGADGGRQPGHAAAEHQQVERLGRAASPAHRSSGPLGHGLVERDRAVDGVDVHDGRLVGARARRRRSRRR